MAASNKDSDTEYVLKKGGDDVPVESCKGWMDPCDYCDKRFCAWIPEDDEMYEKIPEKPGFYMIALKNKNITEVVSIIYEESSIQKNVVVVMDKIRGQISNKKSKATKSEILVRWMIIKNIGDKENAVLCAHWCNNGLLPKYITFWPGMKLLENTDYLTLSKYLQKWCYSKKDPVWRKSKTPSSKIVEEVKKCSFEGPCELCDSSFTPWKSLSDVVENFTAPNDDGLVMLSIVYGKKREVVFISSDKASVFLNIKNEVKRYSQNEKSYLKVQKFADKKANAEVRWMPMKDIDSDNSCFLYAHWFNVDKWPMFNDSYMPGEKPLNRNKNFVLRNQDKKWMYEIEAYKQAKFSKAKNRRRIREELEDENYMETED